MDNGASSYRRFLDGDEHAIDEIMEELFFPLVFFINRYVQDVHAAEDTAEAIRLTTKAAQNNLHRR